METPKILETAKKTRLDAERRETIHKHLDLALDSTKETDEDEIALVSITCILKRGKNRTDYSVATLNLINSSTTLDEISSFATLQLSKLSDDWRTATNLASSTEN